ncbi:MAG: efflux transporter outer membrane subunit [Pseudomonadota bacterium]
MARPQDDETDAVVEEALTHNRRIASARAAVRDASARRRVARAGLLPAAGFEGGYTFADQSINSPAGAGPLIGAGIVDRDIEFWNGTVSAQWDLDLFGGARRLDEAARARVQQSIAARDAVALGVVAETVAAWIELNGALARFERVSANVEAQQRTVDIIERQANVGLARPLDALRAASQRDATASTLPTLQASIDAAAWRLGVLTGRSIDELAASADTRGADGALNDLSQIDLPAVDAAYLRQRPDIAAAERNLAAAVAEVGVSEASFWPQIWLTGSVGLESASLGDLAQGNSRALGLAPRLSLPLFQGGALRAGRDAALARADVAYRDLEEILAASFAEARSAARQVDGARAALAQLQTAVEAAQEAENIAAKRFELGLGSFLGLLDAQRERLRLEEQLIATNTQFRLAISRLFTSLGGDAPALLPTLASTP